MNPELKRNLLIELTRQRLIAMPVILGLIFTAAYTAGDAGTLVVISRAAFWALILLWGTRKAAGVFDSELINNTWDSQRMSAMSATELFLGKLFGGLGFILYGALLCIAANIAAQATLLPRFTVNLLVADLAEVLAALLSITVSMFVAVLLMKRTRTSKGISVTLCQFFAISAALLFRIIWYSSTDTQVFEFGLNLNRTGQILHVWYGLEVSAQWFAVVSLLIFLCWAVLGIVREIGTLLQFRSIRWMWMAFVLFIGLYIAGFEAIYSDIGTLSGKLTIYLGIIWATGLGLTYFAIFIEPKSINAYRAFFDAIRRRSLRDLLEKIPFWMMSLTVALIALILIIVAGGPPAFNAEIGYTAHDGMLDANPRLFLVVLTLFALRDYLLVTTLNLRANAKRADIAALVYLLVLYFVAPIVVGVLGAFQGIADLATGFFRPQPNMPTPLSLLPITIEVLAVALWAASRWRKVRLPAGPGS